VFREACSKIHIGKHLSDTFPIQNGLKHGEALSPFIFNFPLQYAVRKVQEKPGGAKIEWGKSATVYADRVNLMGRNHSFNKEIIH
jgi:hypothetical protein